MGDVRIRNRRKFLKDFCLSGSLWVAGLDKLPWPARGPAEGHLAEVVPFADEGHLPMNEAMGDELDGRLFTDLSVLAPEKPVTPTADFYIRTRASKLLDARKPWSIELGGLVEAPKALAFSELAPSVRPLGVHLMECAGNPRSAHFGMLSAAEWHGIPLQEILGSVKPISPNHRILISGFDQYSMESTSSLPGASWIFATPQLESSGAFLATKMNGQPLSLDHGAPIRLVVPNWYGCASIKWVNQILWVPDDAQATSQMKEYATRTGQTGVPRLAREYSPATLDVAAMPVRVEKWFVKGKIEFHVLGIEWGGSQAVEGLEIQFHPSEPYVPVSDFQYSSAATWNFWRHIWAPTESGRYLVRLRAKPLTIPARRLLSGYYLRSVDITSL